MSAFDNEYPIKTIFFVDRISLAASLINCEIIGWLNLFAKCLEFRAVNRALVNIFFSFRESIAGEFSFIQINVSIPRS